jgi:hypothetical protein
VHRSRNWLETNRIDLTWFGLWLICIFRFNNFLF